MRSGRRCEKIGGGRCPAEPGAEPSVIALGVEPNGEIHGITEFIPIRINFAWFPDIAIANAFTARYCVRKLPHPRAQ